MLILFGLLTRVSLLLIKQLTLISNYQNWLYQSGRVLSLHIEGVRPQRLPGSRRIVLPAPVRHLTSLSPGKLKRARQRSAAAAQTIPSGILARREGHTGTDWQSGKTMSVDITDDFAKVLVADPESRISDIQVGDIEGATDTAVGPELQIDRDPTNWRSWRGMYVFSLVAADSFAAVLAIIVTALALPDVAVAHNRLDLMGWRVSYRVLGVISLAVWLLVLVLDGAYRSHYPSGGLRQYRIRAVTAFRLMAFVVIASFALHATVSRAIVLVFFPSLAGASLICQWVLRNGLARLRRNGLALNRLVLVGNEAAVEKLTAHFLRDLRHGYEIVGVCLPGARSGRRRELRTRGGTFPIVGTPDGLVEVTKRLSVDSAAIVGSLCFESTSLQQVAWQLERRDVDLLVAPDVIDVAGPRVRFAPVTGMPLLQITEPRIYGPGRWLKPCYERLLSIPLLVLASPLLLIIAIAILIDSGRPIFFRQKRIGFGGEEFEMLKFRSMVRDADKMLPELLARNDHDGALFKLRDDPRVTRIGRFLRKYSLDELAQLINVIKGDMLLIGPRPCLRSETEGFGEAARRRFLARPGMTGLWQVSGRSDIPWEEAVRLDLYYVENWSLMMDLMILWRTFAVVGGGRSGY
jgi:exopolysaccharide biosynthesis polyprenyl glycosylphosphotransferase